MLVLVTAADVFCTGNSAHPAESSVRGALATQAALNAGGGMEIILGVIAYQPGVSDEQLIVALVLIARAAPPAGGPAVRRLLPAPTPRLSRPGARGGPRSDRP